MRAHAALEATNGELSGLRVELESASTELSALRGELGARDRELAETRWQLDKRDEQLAGARGEVGSATRRSRRPAASSPARRAARRGARRDRPAAQRARDLAGELDALRADADAARAERDAEHRRAEQLRADAERSHASLEAIRAEFAFDVPPAPAMASSFAPPPPAPFAAPPAPTAPAPVAPAAPPTPAPAPVAHGPELPPSQPGIATALIGADGTFMRLDEAFCSLLGSREDELRHARWPSVIDRDNFKDHQEIARKLRSGELQSANIETIYMHKRGLLVPVEGTVAMHRDAGGRPYVIFRADVRRTSGAPAGR